MKILLLFLLVAPQFSKAKTPELSKKEFAMASTVKFLAKNDFALFSGASDCYNATPATLSKELSVKLCRGAQSTAPADCYNDTPSTLNKELSVTLCQGALSIEPSTCYKETPSDLSPELSVELCKASNRPCQFDE